MKKNILKITAMSLLILILSISTCFGASDEEYVRIRIRSPRVYNEQSSIQSYEDITVYELDGKPEELFQLNEDSLCLLLDSYFDSEYSYTQEKNKASVGPNHVVLDQLYSSFEKADRVANELEEEFREDFFPQLSNDGYRIYGGMYADMSRAKELMEEMVDEGYEVEVVCTDMQNVAAYDDNDNVAFMYSNDMDIYFSSYNDGEDREMIKIDKKPYRGFIGFKIIDNSKLISINFVDLESYLYGVVPNEISASWGKESLKAQAVAARTYAVSCLSPYASYGYDMDDNQNSQVYMGYSSEKESTNEAVDETKGEMIYYEDKLIQAFYHSTSGGTTENTENVWSSKLPYAVAVDDEYSDRSDSPYNEWQKSYKRSEIIKMLNDDGNNVDELYSIEIAEISENNRVLKCIFLTDIGEIVYYKEDARLVLGLMSQWFTVENGTVYYFTNEFTFDKSSSTTEDDGLKQEVPSRGGILDHIIDEIPEEDAGNETADTVNRLDTGSVTGRHVISSSGTKKLTQDKISVISSSGVSVLDTSSSDYNFQGRGWGHGIGMSQYGAKQMAEEGYKYDEILEHYYTGVTIK